VKKGLFLKTIGSFALVFVLLPAAAKAQIPLSNVASATLNATLTETLSVSLTGGSTVSFALVPGGNATGSVPVGITTSWVLKPTRTAVKLVGYFDTTDALTDTVTSTNHIASANVLGRVATGTPTTFTAFTSTVSGIGTPGASLELFSEGIGGSNKNETRTDSLDLEIDLTSVPQQPAGDYTGTLRIQAIVL